MCNAQEWLKYLNFCLSAELLFQAKEGRSGSESRSGLDAHKHTWAPCLSEPLKHVARSRCNALTQERLRAQPRNKGDFTVVQVYLSVCSEWVCRSLSVVFLLL